MFKVTVNGNLFFAEGGTLLSAALAKNGIFVEHPCGGKGLCKRCTVKVNGKDELCCTHVVNSDIAVEIPEAGKDMVYVKNTENQLQEEKLCLCLDIGTTTLELALIDREKKEILKTIKALNPQMYTGADVMSRITYGKEKGFLLLQECVVSKINAMLLEMRVEHIEKMYVSANTVMLHMLFGEDCSSLGVAPYTPVFLHSREAQAKEVGIERVSKIETLPCLSAFVGADIVAGVLFAGLPSKGKYNLLVDLGTNAELVLWNENSGLCTSAACGPCFEGGNISCGMRATEGAISSFSQGKMSVVGNTLPKGLCASGLIDVISHLARKGKIDKSGYMAEDFSIAYGISLTPEDVREYQTAKSAVHSAIKTLVKEAGVSFENIEKLYICGGFSQGLNIKNAVFTGLIPKELEEKCVLSGNTSLSGAVKYALSDITFEIDIQKFPYIELASNPFFTDEFIKNMEVYS